MDVKQAIDNLLSRGEITAAEHEKVASLFSEGKELTAHGGAVKDALQTLALASFAGIGGYQLYDLIKQKRAEASGYKNMMAKNPSLSEYPEEQVKDYFSVVDSFSPKSASNPLVAGALVNKMIQFGGVDHKIVQDLANIEGPKSNILYDVASKAGQSLASFPGGSGGGDK